MRCIYHFFFHTVAGWRIESELPMDLKRYIVLVAPHTSNFDFFLGISCRSLIPMGDVKFLAKESLFKPPLGWFFRYMGGYPVVRSKSMNQVDTVVAMFDRGEIDKTTITPEGTRKYQPKWKTGFHYISRKANVPIIICAFDYPNKRVVVSGPFPLTDDLEGDIVRIKEYLRPFKGRNPEDGIRY